MNEEQLEIMNEIVLDTNFITGIKRVSKIVYNCDSGRGRTYNFQIVRGQHNVSNEKDKINFH